MVHNSDLHHFLQLRVSKTIIATIDDVIASTPELDGFSRCRFIRYAIGFALASILARSVAVFNTEHKS